MLVTLKVARSTSSSRLLYWEHNPKAMSTEATCCSNCVFLDSVLVYLASDLTAEVVHNLPWDPMSILWSHLLQLTRIPRHYVPCPQSTPGSGIRQLGTVAMPQRPPGLFQIASPKLPCLSCRNPSHGCGLHLPHHPTVFSLLSHGASLYGPGWHGKPLLSGN